MLGLQSFSAPHTSRPNKLNFGPSCALSNQVTGAFAKRSAELELIDKAAFRPRAPQWEQLLWEWEMEGSQTQR